MLPSFWGSEGLQVARKVPEGLSVYRGRTAQFMDTLRSSRMQFEHLKHVGSGRSGQQARLLKTGSTKHPVSNHASVCCSWNRFHPEFFPDLKMSEALISSCSILLFSALVPPACRLVTKHEFSDP